MPTTITDPDLARLLPGSWTVVATNAPQWLDGTRTGPVRSFELVSETPLRFKDTVSYSTAAGEAKIIVGADRSHGGVITRRGSGLRALLPSRWRVTGKNDAETVLVAQYDKAGSSPSSIDIIVRAGVSEPEVRSIVASNAKSFGLTLEQFATLYWFSEV